MEGFCLVSWFGVLFCFSLWLATVFGSEVSSRDPIPISFCSD